MEARNGFKQTEIGLIPEDWEVGRLGEVVEISAGGSAPQDDRFFGGNNPFIRVSHIDNEAYRISNWDYITDEAIKVYKLKKFPKNTIVFPKSGATIYLEKRALLPFDAYIVSHLFGVNSKRPEKLDQFFLFYALIKIKFAKEKGDGYPTLNIPDVVNKSIPLPPLPVQQKIVEILLAVDEKIQAEENKKKALENLFKSMLHNLMSGKIRVKQLKEVSND